MVLDAVKMAGILFASLIAGIIILFVSIIIVEWILATTVNGKYKLTGFCSFCGFSGVYILNYMWFSVMLSWYQETRVADTIFPDYYPLIILIIALIYMGVASLCYNTWVRIMNVGTTSFGIKPCYNYYGCWGYEVKSTWGETMTFIPLINWHKKDDKK